MTVSILIGDVREKLRELPADHFDCVVTSPPYWGLRDYGVDGQIGLEPTLGEHLAVMVDVFREVRRVLKPTGTLWVNYGDCYASTPNGRSAADTKAAGNDDRTFRDKPLSTVGPIYDPAGGAKGGGKRGENKGNANDTPQGRICAGGYLKPKDLCMVPNRIAIALQEDGWWVRSEIIWAKPNPMPESIKDRPATSHEKIFLLTKSERYAYNAEAVKEPAVSDNPSGNGFKREARLSYRDENGPRGNDKQWTGVGGRRNMRNVWTFPIYGYPEAHFATFPPELAERCIKAGCPEGGNVLDPFGGSGTTALVADRLGRDCTLIELNPEYAAMAERRIKGDAPLFAKVAAE